MNPTSLVHRVYLRLVRQRTRWPTKADFLGLAAETMRRVIVDHARARLRLKRGGGAQPISLEHKAASIEEPEAMLALNECLERLSRMDPQQEKVVELRYFGGFSVEETAAILNVSPRTVKREWSLAKAWLYGELKENGFNTRAVAEGQGPR